MKTVSEAIQSSKHYEIGDLGIELIDIIKAKLPPGAYQWFLWASAEQYSFRFMNKGCHMEDLKKRDTYAKWLREDIEQRGLCMGHELSIVELITSGAEKESEPVKKAKMPPGTWIDNRSIKEEEEDTKKRDLDKKYGSGTLNPGILKPSGATWEDYNEQNKGH
jgi:hypothetical protein